MQEYLRRGRTAGLSWPLPDLDDDELHERLYPRTRAAAHYPTPDFESIQRELATKGVTRMLLWREYKERHPDGCQYSAFAPSAATTRPGWVGRTRSCASSMCRAIRQSADGAAACVVTASGKQ